MNIDYINQQIFYIKIQEGNDEGQHAIEDQLREDFIEHVATLQNHLGDMARLVLSTKNIEFERWYA